MAKINCRDAGVSLEVLWNGYPLLVGHNGRLGGRILFPGKAVVKVEVEPYARAYPFVNRFYRVETLPHSGNALVYMKDVGINRSGPVSYPENGLRLLQIGQGGFIKVWEAGITRRRDADFLVFQQNYATRCYNYAGRAVCPYFNDWPPMHVWLEELLAQEVLTLKPLSAYAPEMPPNLKELPENYGICRWFNVLRGQGCARVNSDHGPIDVLVRWQHIASDNPVPFLIPGREVYCPDRHRISLPRCSFLWEALEIQQL